MSPSPNPFALRDQIRFEVCAPFLAGTGIEIGAGAFPSMMPSGASAHTYDVRSRDELARLFDGAQIAPVRPLEQMRVDFPQGAPFLVAHNVLEHTADPIGTLIGWHRCVAPGGTVVLSLPDKNACPDHYRLEPPFEHLLHDYALRRGHHAFESREHILSFALAWMLEDGSRSDRTVGHVVAEALPAVMARNADVHWHAFTQSLAQKTVLAACGLAGDGAELLAKADFTTTPRRTLGDIILVYRLRPGVGRSTGFSYSIDEDLRRVKTELVHALQRLESASAAPSDVAGLDEPHPMVDAPYPMWLDRLDRPPTVDLHPPFAHEVGHCFRFTGLFARHPGDSEGSDRSPFRLLEDGQELGPAHSSHASIRENGRGRFSHWRDALYFSTSDNSDPNTNGRRYQLKAD